MNIEALVTSVILLCTATAVAIYSFTTFVQCCISKPIDDLQDIHVVDVSPDENQILSFRTHKSVAKFYTPRQKHLQRFILFMCTAQVVVQGSMYGAVRYLPRPGQLNLHDVLDNGFYALFIHFWLPIVTPKTITMLFTTCLFGSVGIWFIRVFFASMQQRYEQSRSGKELQPLSPDSQTHRVQSRIKYAGYRASRFINNHGVFLLSITGIFIISIVLIFTLVFQGELLRSEIHRLILIGTINGFTALLAICVSITFIYGVVYHLNEIRFSYDTLEIVRRSKNVIPVFLLLAITYMVVYFLWGFRVYPISCLRLHFPFQDVHPGCSGVEIVTDSVDVTTETLIWFLLFVLVPSLILTIIFRKISNADESGHIIPISQSQSEQSPISVDGEEVPDQENLPIGYRRMSSAITLKEKTIGPKRFSLDHAKLTRTKDTRLCINIAREAQ